MNGTQMGALSAPEIALGTALILLGLFIFGIIFNVIIERWGDADGFVWLQVVIGTVITLAGMGLLDVLLDWNAFFLGLVAFTASGAPMIYGDVRRYNAKIQRLKNLQKELRGDDTTEALAE